MSITTKDILYYIIIFAVIAIDFYSFRKMRNFIEKNFLMYYYYINDKKRYYYHHYIMVLLLIYITFIFYGYISFYLMVIFIMNIFMEKLVVKELMEKIKLKSTRTDINKPEDIIDQMYLDQFIADDTKREYSKGTLDNSFLPFLNYYLLFSFTILENMYFKQMI